MIDYLNQWMSLVRFSILSALFLINLSSLVRLMLFNIKSDKRNNRHCLHTVTSSLIVLANLFYLLTWLPYLGLSMYDTNWSNVNSLEQCILQHLTSSIFTTLLLTVLVIRKIYCCFHCQNAKIISLALVFAWILPQTTYLSIVELFGVDKFNPFENSNKLIPFRSYFTSYLETELIELESNQTTVHFFETNDLKSGTFVICVQKLTSQLISQLSWHFTVLVIPLTTIVFLSFIGQALNKHFYSFNDKYINKNCDCKDDLLISFCLYFNLIWVLVLRPLIVLQTLILKHAKNSKQSNHSQQTYLDFGTHLVLIFTVFFVPFSTQGGFRTLKTKKLKHQLNPLIRNQQQNINLSPSVLAMNQPYHPNISNRTNYFNSNNVSNLPSRDDSSYHAFSNVDSFYHF